MLQLTLVETLVFLQTFPVLSTLEHRPLEDMGKSENAGNQHFQPFPHCFLLCQRQILPF